MERTTFFEHYRISNEYDGSPAQVGQIGAATIYKASDTQSAAPVALTLLPLASVDPDFRERLQEQARAAQLLDHINISKILASGIVDDQFVVISEFPEGETVESWINAHGPMPPDAVLRIALQVVSALSAGTFHGLVHPAIEPSNLTIVPGQTAEGGWPLIKLMNFGLAGFKAAPGAEENAPVSEFASPEQLKDGTVDFRSEIYSLGATICFLLTGAFYSAEPRSLQTRRFSRPLRKLIAPMLQEDPNERPPDPVLFAQAVRACLVQVEGRQALARKFGIPFIAVAPTKPKKVLPVTTIKGEPVEPGRFWSPRKAWLVGALLLAVAGVVAAMLLPTPVRLATMNRDRDKQAIGVPVGVPENSPKSVTQGVPPANLAATTAKPTPAPIAQQSPAPVASASPVVTPVVATLAAPSASPSTEAADASAAPAPAEGPQTVWERAAGSSARAKISNGRANAGDESIADGTTASRSGEKPKGGSRIASSRRDATSTDAESDTAEEQPNEKSAEQDNVSKAPKNPRDVIANSRYRGTTPSRPRIDQDETDRRLAVRRQRFASSSRARVIGRTPDGYVIWRLPSGDTVVAPPRYRTRRIYMDRPPYTMPPPQYGPMYPYGY